MYFRHRPSFKDPVNNPFDVTCVLNLVVLTHFKSSDWFLFEIEQWSEMVYHRRNPLRMRLFTHSNYSLAFADELFECDRPFCGVGA